MAHGSVWPSSPCQDTLQARTRSRAQSVRGVDRARVILAKDDGRRHFALDRREPDMCVLQVGTCVPLETRHPLEVKVVGVDAGSWCVLRLIRKKKTRTGGRADEPFGLHILNLDTSHPNLIASVVQIGDIVRLDLVLHDLRQHNFLTGVQYILQELDSPLSCRQYLEELCDMKRLLVPDDVDHLVEMVLVVALDSAGDVSHGIDSSAIFCFNNGQHRDMSEKMVKEHRKHNVPGFSMTGFPKFHGVKSTASASGESSASSLGAALAAGARLRAVLSAGLSH